ncbi:MAG TPA: SET domain-containing protein [Nevskiaceae bacterium]|nr:SET domain-containing protein [Nevskiaceae bacterium]
MILFPHYVAASAIEGVGLFTRVALAAGTPLYRCDARFLTVIGDGEIAALPPAMREAMSKYTYRGRGPHRLQGARYYGLDDSRFMNHSDAPNSRWVAEQELYVAACDIPAGSEITCDYREFTEPGDWEQDRFLASA